MALFKIVTHPSPVLRKKTSPIVDFHDKNLEMLIQDMAETMYGAPGVGLAANQVGLSLRMAVIDVIWKKAEKPEEKEKKKLLVFINPEIIDKKEPFTFEEGCLSIPGVREIVRRFNRVTVRYQDIRGTKKTLSAEGLLAVALQHETDHLNGKLYIDHLSPLKRGLLLKKYKNVLKDKPPKHFDDLGALE
ncbi:MAG: peptide deformylase [Deltaproteobacteria bacterium]